jgi:arabinose-5-phosphate isomerase
MDYLEKAGRVLDIEIFELKRLRERLGEDFSRAVELIKEAVDARGKVVVVGVGKSGHIGAKIAATLTSTGSPAVVLDSSNALHGDLGVVADGDVVLALSASGETEEMVRILPAIARFQVRIIAICGDPKSTLAQNAHLFLDVNIEQEACPLNLAPTSSTTVMLALGDALAMVLLEARGFNKEDFAKFHPGGMIGRSMLVRVHQVMRPRGAMAIVSTDTSVRDVLKAMTGVRAGAAVVTDENQKLLGIFTHGDFVRQFQFDSKIGERLVADLMTLNPVTVHKDKLAVEVLNLLERHRIDDLVVVVDDSVPVGIVDSQDLTRLKLLLGTRVGCRGRRCACPTIANSPSACKIGALPAATLQRFNNLTFHARSQRSSQRNGHKIQWQRRHCSRSSSSHPRKFARIRSGDHPLYQHRQKRRCSFWFNRQGGVGRD